MNKRQGERFMGDITIDCEMYRKDKEALKGYYEGVYCKEMTG